MAYIDCENCYHGKVCQYRRIYHDMVVVCEHWQPTADVVPKSEVEELKAIIKDHQANEERWQELYADTVNKWEKAYEELEIKLENAKTEGAREIFEDIECAMFLAERQHRPFNSCNYVDYYDFSLEIEVERLKKKYTEGGERQ